MARRCLFAIAGLAFALHGLGISRGLVPAQDGLKFIRFARDFQRQPWDDVVRGSDQHPLYSALIALAEPPVALALGEGPTAWRVAAQLVSALASIATLIPLFGLARALFGERAALLATLVYALLPIPAAIGRDTLSDSLALLFFATALRLGEVALRTGRRSAWVGTGLAAGLGYLVRPEILVVPVAVVVTAVWSAIGPAFSHAIARLRPGEGRASATDLVRPLLARVAVLGVAALTLVGSYALVKGEVSEKLSLRNAASIGHSARSVRTARPSMPPGLDDPRWDFAPKEEGADPRLKGSAGKTAIRLVQQWSEGFGWVMLPFVAWGVVAAGRLDGSTVGRRLVGVYLVLFAAIVIRHATGLGYLSGRHALTIVAATVPWAGAGLWAWARDLPARRGLGPAATRRLAILGLAAMIGLGATVQVRAMHPSRWGHYSAGQWLRTNAGPNQSVLDTRGWAMFVRGEGRGYDYWHVRQALTDASLAYVVVGTDELKARSRRAATLRAILAYAGTPVAEFPDRSGEAGVGVQVFRFARPDSWRGMNR